MTRTPLAVACAAVLLAAAAPLAIAAPSSKPQVTDPAGDALPLPGFDIVSGQLTTTGVTTTRKVGRRVVKTYKPKSLVAKVTLSEAPSTSPGARISFGGTFTACGGGTWEFTYTPGATITNGGLFVTGCGEDNGAGPAEGFKDVVAVVKDKTITWTMPLADMGPDLPLSTVFSDLRVSSDLADPVTGIIGTNVFGGSGSLDTATTDATWKLG